MGRGPGAAVPRGAGTKGLLAGRPEPFSCLLGLSAGNVAGSRADQRLGARRRVGRARPRQTHALWGNPRPARLGGERPFVRAFGGDEPRPETAEHQLNACLQPAPSPARSTGAPPCTPLRGKVTAPSPSLSDCPISRPEIAFLPGGRGMQARGDLAPSRPSPRATALPAPASPTTRHLSLRIYW